MTLMEGETNLDIILKNLQPILNDGRYVFCTVSNTGNIPPSKILFFFREAEGVTVVLEKQDAEVLELKFSYVAAWITLKVHSSLAAVGLTAAFAQALGKSNISCNVVAAYFHDHIFVDEKDANKAMMVLKAISTGA